MIQERYRRDYVGEFVITNTTIRNGQKIQSREWRDNTILDQWITGCAAVIVGNDDRDRFNHTVLEHHRGGLRGTKRLQTYGTLDVWRDMRLDYYATTQAHQLHDISQHEYYQSNQFFSRYVPYTEITAVFTTSSLSSRYPGRCHLVPHTPILANAAMPLYLAAFDGNTEIYMLGYSKEFASPDQNWISDIEQIMDVYPGCQFFLIGTETNQPDVWRKKKNVRCLTHREFITRCDV